MEQVTAMELIFTWDNVFSLVLTVLMFLFGIRDFQGKDPLINLPFNQYNRDPEYRAYWQKKNGILYMFNAVMSLLAFLIPTEHFGGSHLLGVAAAVDVIYLIVYEIWEHSND